MSSYAAVHEPGNGAYLNQGLQALASERNWYAVFTLPQNEKSAAKHLDIRDIETFLPTYETVRVWKNRQRVKTILPLFPTYLFVRINRWERVKVLGVPRGPAHRWQWQERYFCSRHRGGVSAFGSLRPEG